MYKIFNCNCGCGGVEVSRWTDGCEDCVYIEFLKRNRAGRRLKTRLKMMWWLLSRGYYYDDDIVLSAETARELGEELLMLSKEKSNEDV